MFEELSEPILVIGKGVPAYSTKYGCLTYCIAGVNKQNEWLRLYPLFSEPIISSIVPIEEFDVIRVVFRDKHPEPTRPESRKILPESVEKLGQISKKVERRKILNKITDSGEFLHDNSWNGIKTLGMIKPMNTNFLLKDEVPMVQFSCGNSCNGHICQVGDCMTFDNVGRRVQEEEDIIEEKLSRFKNKELRLVMGTLRRHPNRWLLISIHVIES